MTLKIQQTPIILIVDDNPNNLQVLSKLLIEQGWEILVATDGLMALEQAEDAHPDLILLDVMMPKIDGFETCRRLKSHPVLNEIPVIFMTALNRISDKLQGFAVGGVDYISKPYQVEEVLARINVHLQLRSLTRNLEQKNEQLNEKNAVLQQEIRDRQQAESALQEALKFNQQIIASAQEGVIVLDRNLNYQVWNHYLETLSGISQEMALGKHPLELFPFLQKNGIFSLMQRALAGETVVAPDARFYISCNGKQGWTSEKFSPLYDAESNIIGVIGIISDITDRKQSEAALSESEERFRTMANSAPVLLWISDAAGQCTFFNQGWLDFTGRSLEEELGEGWATGVHPDDMERCLKIFHTGLKNHQSFQIEYRLRRFNGEYRWIFDHGAPRFASNGDFVGFIGSCIDISDRKLAEEALRESQQQLQAIASNIPGGVFRSVYHADGSHVCLFVSEGYRTLLGIEPELFKSDPKINLQIIHPDDQVNYVTSMAEAIAKQETSFQGEVRYILPTGEVKWIATSAQVYRQENGDVIVDGIDIDITYRKQAEDAVRTSEENFRQLANTVREVFFIFEPSSFTFSYLSPSFRKIYGISAEALQKEPLLWVKTVHPEDYDRVYEALQRELAGEVFDEEYRIIKPDGEVRWVRVQAFPLMDQPGTVNRIVGIVIDITDSKQAEDQIRASLQEKEALLAEIHHRVKNNLQIISSLLNLQAFKIDDPQVRKALEDSWTRIDSMALVHETLYRSQDFSSINFAEYLENLTQNLFHTYNTQAETIHLDIQVDHEIALSLNQAIPCGLIVNELITNALKHAFKSDQNQAEAKQLFVQLAQTTDHHIQLSVGNSGDTLPSNFNPYKTRSMGLQLVTSLVEQLEGTLDVKRGDRTLFIIAFDPTLEDHDKTP